MSHNRIPFKTAALVAAIVATPLTEAASRNYHEPTRGFFIEHGEVAPVRKASVELQTGRDLAGANDSNLGGGIRLGLSGGELLINSGLGDYDQNELMLKWGLPAMSGGNGVNWAVLGGISHLDAEDDATPTNEFEQTNLKVGVAFTLRADAGVFTITPMLVHADAEIHDGVGQPEEKDDTFLELGIGAYVGLIDTSAGKFSIGAEALITTQDEVFNYGNLNAKNDKDNTFALGVKWAYSERVHIDIVPLVHSNDELLGIPGLVRLNMAF